MNGAFHIEPGFDSVHVNGELVIIIPGKSKKPGTIPWETFPTDGFRPSYL